MAKDSITPAPIRCKASDLRAAITAAASVVRRYGSIPILLSLRITPTAEGLEIEGTDLDAWMRVRCPVIQGEDDDPFTIPAQLARQLLAGAAPDDDVDITRDGDVLTIQVGPVTARIRDLHAPEDFPDPPVLAGAQATIAEGVLLKAINNTAWAVSNEETRYYLHGVYLHGRDGHLAAAATDGHRLALYQTHDAWTADGVILPHPAIDPLRRRLTAGGNRPISIRVDPVNNRTRFDGDGWSMTVKTIDGDYPSYPKVIPERDANAGYAVLSRETLQRMPSQIESGAFHAIRLDLTAKTASMRVSNVEIALPIEAGGAFVTGFQARYLREISRRFGTIRIESRSTSGPAHVLTDDPDLTVVVMPVSVD